MTPKIRLRVAAGLLLPLWALTASPSSTAPAIIPLPQKMERHSGDFTLQSATRILADASSCDTGEFLAQQLRKSTGFALKVELAPPTARPGKGNILLTTQDAHTASDEEA